MFTIRKMNSSDITSVANLEKSCFSQPWSRQAFEEILTIPYRMYFVALDNDEVIGGCMLSDIAGEGEITNVAVFEKYRRQHVAQKLLTALFEEGEKHHISDYTLEVRAGNTAAIKLYEKNGFKTEGIRKNFYELPVEDALIMWKRQNKKEYGDEKC